MRFVALLLIASLAGCLGGSDGEGNPSQPGPSGQTTSQTSTARPDAGPLPLLLDYDYEGCHGVTVHAAAPTDQVQAVLPDGYTALPMSDGDGTRVLYTWWQCSSFTTRTTERNDTVLGFSAAEAEAPDGTGVFYLARMFATADVMQVLWETAGYPVHVGAFEQATGPMAPLPGLTRSVTFNGYGVEATAPVDTQMQFDGVPFYTETANGRLEWTMESFDLGTVQSPLQYDLSVPADDPFGETTGQAVLLVTDAAMTGNRLYLVTSS